MVNDWGFGMAGPTSSWNRYLEAEAAVRRTTRVKGVEGVSSDELLDILKEATLDGVIFCRECGEQIEPDCPECPSCGWKNPIIEMGMI
jgi:rubrerythrin